MESQQQEQHQQEQVEETEGLALTTHDTVVIRILTPWWQLPTLLRPLESAEQTISTARSATAAATTTANTPQALLPRALQGHSGIDVFTWGQIYCTLKSVQKEHSDKSVVCIGALSLLYLCGAIAFLWAISSSKTTSPVTRYGLLLLVFVIPFVVRVMTVLRSSTRDFHRAFQRTVDQLEPVVTQRTNYRYRLDYDMDRQVCCCSLWYDFSSNLIITPIRGGWY